MATNPASSDLPEGMGGVSVGGGTGEPEGMGQVVPSVGGGSDLSDVMGPAVPAVGGDGDLPEGMGTVSP